jgi:hypothetical protein
VSREPAMGRLRRWLTDVGMTGFGASFPLPYLPAKVSSLNAERPLSLGGANWPSCAHSCHWRPIAKSLSHASA